MTTGPSDPVATFLSIVVPWAKDTYVNVEAFEYIPGKNGGKGKLLPKAFRAARDLPEASSFARWCDSMGWEVYVRMASFRRPGAGKVGKNGRVNYRTISIKENAVCLRSFFVDVDVKPGAYATLEEARSALLATCATLGLPRPSVIVYSGGGGFHAHLVLDNPIPVADWLVQARKLATACRQHGLKADHNVTVNPVCLLRVPGTTNRKYGQPRPVVLEPSLAPSFVYEQIKVALLTYQEAALENSSETQRVSPENDWPHLLKNTSGLGPGQGLPWLEGISQDLLALDEVAEGCPLVRKAIETGGKDHENPLWFMLGHVAVFTEGGVKDFHRLGDQHPTYDPEETDAQFDRIRAKRDADDMGWPRCATMENNGSVECKTCEHRGKGKSPLNFAVRTVTPPGNPPPPGGSGGNPPPPPGGGGGPPPTALKVIPLDGYVDIPSGHYSYEKTDPKGNTINARVWSYPMWNLDLKEDMAGAFAIHFDTRMAKQQVVHVVLPTMDLRNGDTMRGRLTGRHGLGILSTELKGLFDFMANFKSQMRERLATVARQELMGWTDEDGKPTGFIYGPTRYTPAGSTPFNQPDGMIRDQYFPTGSIKPWRDAMAMIHAEERPAMDILVATSFAAPLMRFTSEKGVVISAFSSGTAAHKTTAIRVGQAVWGGPKGISQHKDTLNAVVAHTGKTRVVPKYFDEMRSANDTKYFVDMLFSIASGRGKARLNRNAEERTIDTWETLLVGVSNTSLFDHIVQQDKNTDAGVARVFEFEIFPPSASTPGQIPLARAGEILKALDSNYGRAGEIYAEHLGRSVATLPDKVSAMMTVLQDELDMQGGERFWISAAAAILVGAQEANSIGLTKFNIDLMKAYIHLAFNNMRLARIAGNLDPSKQENTKAILTSFIATNRRSLLATDTVGVTGGGIRVSVLNMSDVTGYTDQFRIRYVRDPTPILRFSKSALTEWLTKQDLPTGVFFKNLRTHYHTKEHGATSLTSGTNYGNPKERLVEIDLVSAGLEDLYEI